MLVIFKSIYKVFRCIREFVMSLFFILFVMICFAVVSLLQTDTKMVKQPVPVEKGALLLNLDGYLADNHDEFGDFHRFVQSELGGSSDPAKISVFDVVRAIKAAEYDDKITGLVLDLRYFEGGDLASLHFVGDEITRFKKSNKPVLAIGEYYTQKQYFLASFADKVYLNRAGFVDLHGLNYSTLYFKSLFEKIEAIPHVFRVGTYKSAVEPFLRDDMSPEAKANASLWLEQLWGQFSQKVAENRQINAKTIVPEISQYLADYKKAKGDDAQYALQKGFVTELVDNQQLQQILLEQFGKHVDGDYNYVSFFDYVATLSDRFDVQDSNKIAVVNVEGEIILGESDESSAGSDTIVNLLRKAREDNDVKGVILRVNSPGGSAMASELIRQEIDAVQQAGKPVVVSMGGMAASGGYWISATSDKIVASPNTLTGSIGIFGLAVSFEQTAKNLGISEDGVATSPLAKDIGFKPVSKAQGEILQIGIENGYDRFIELVSRGRKMSKSEVDKVAQGQVWTGQAAFERGLVDELGDFNQAYQSVVELVNQQRKAKGEAEIEGFSTQWMITQDDDLLSQFMRDFKLQLPFKVSTLFDLPLVKSAEKPLELLNKFNDPKQMYLYCLNCGTVK